MRQGKKWAALTGVLLASCIMTGCSDDISRAFDSAVGNERTLPDGDEIVFTKPHRPILNPINNFPPVTDMSSAVYEGRMAYGSNDDSYNTASSNTSTGSVSHTSRSGRHIPQENIALLSGEAAPAPAQQVAKADVMPSTAPADSMAASSAAQVASIQTAPANPSIDSALDTALAKQPDPIAITKAGTATEDQTSVHVWNASKSNAPAAAKATAEPAATAPEPAAPQPTMGNIKLTPPAAPYPGDISSVTSATPVMASAQSTAPADSQAAANDAAAVAQAAAEQPASGSVPQVTSSGYPTLSSVPDAPKRTPDKEISSEIHSLSSDRTSNQAAGTALMNNTDSTVMTSPKTGELVTDPAKAMAAASPSAGDSDLTVPPSADVKPASDTITKALEADNKQNNQPTPPADASTAALAAAAPAAGQQDSTPAAATETPPATQVAASSDPIALTAAAPAPAPSAPAPAPSANATEVVHLQPPTTIAEVPAATDANKQLTDVVMQGAEEPTAQAPKTVTYLPENRYAKRRLAPVDEAFQ